MERMTTLLEAEPRSAYIHVPFCVHRCGYCDFTLVARRDDLIDAYLEALAIDLARLERPRDVDTLFFGGGTPTHLPVPQLARLMMLARRWFPPAPGAEICLPPMKWVRVSVIKYLLQTGKIGCGVFKGLAKLIQPRNCIPDVSWGYRSQPGSGF